jgi:branched-chain amino acid transport system substrate-binding protein
MVNPDFFPQGSSVLSAVYGITQIAKSFGPKMGLLYCAEAPICAAAIPLYQAMAKASGVSIPYVAKVSATTPDYTAACQALKNAGVSSVNSLVPSDAVVRIQHACAEQGLSAKQVNMGGTLTAQWLSEPALDGSSDVALDAPFSESSTPALQEFHQALRQYGSDIGTGVGPQSMEAWVAGKLFEKAIALAPDGPITPDSIKQGLWKIKDETLGGLAPPLSFVQDQPTAINCYFVISIQSAKFTAPNGVKTDCAPDAVMTPLVTAIRKG